MWICKHCNEKLDDTFDVCWNCGTSREGKPPAKQQEFNKIKEQSVKKLNIEEKETINLEELDANQLKAILVKITIGMKIDELKELIGRPDVTMGDSEFLNLFQRTIAIPKNEMEKVNWLYRTQFGQFQLIIRTGQIIDTSGFDELCSKIGISEKEVLKVNCTNCSVIILKQTYDKYGGLCAKCYNLKNGAAKNKGCYIATATFMDYDHPKVTTFLNFRDEILSKNHPGKSFINFYYKVSPFLSKLIIKYSLLRKMSKFLLGLLSVIIVRYFKKCKFINNSQKDAIGL